MSFNYLKTSSWATLCYTASGILSRGITFFMLPYFLAHLSLEEFGIWDWYHGWSVSLVSLGSGFSITALPRFVALYSNDQQQRAISNCLYASLIASSIVALIALPFLFKTCSLYCAYTVGIVCLSIPFNNVLSYCSSLQYVGYYSALCFAHHLCTSLLTALLFWQGYTTLSFFAGHCIALSIFLPFFVGLLWYYNCPDKTIAYQQGLYSLPIIIHCFIYTLFGLIDRSALHQSGSSTDLGTYALLVRFAALFHIMALSITNAWPALCFEAHKNSEQNTDVAQLIMYFSLFLWIGYFGTCIATAVATQLFFIRYSFIMLYMPLFLLSPLLLSFAQLYSVGSSINNTTLYLPFLTAATALIQYALLLVFKPICLYKLTVLNFTAFGMYVVGNILISKHYVPQCIDIKRIGMLHTISLVWVVLISILFFYQWPISSIIGVIIIWLLSLTILFFRSEIVSFRSTLQRWFTSKISILLSIKKQKKNIKTILFLRTDISDDISAQCGGASAQTLGVIKGFQDNNITVHVASYSMQQIFNNHPSIHFTHLKVWPWRSTTDSAQSSSACLKTSNRRKSAMLGFIKWRVACLVSNITFLLQLRAVFREHSIDAIYQSYTVLNMTGMLARVLWNVPIIIEYNGSEVWTYQRANNQKWFRFDRLAYCIEKITQMSANCLIVVSQVLKDSLSKELGATDHILLAANGVCTQTYDPLLLKDDRMYLRNNLGIQDRFVIGYTGTFSHWHGTELFDKLLAQACTQFPTIHFILIGDGPAYEPLRRLVSSSSSLSSRVTLTGYVPPIDNRRYLSACDLYLCPAAPSIDGIRNFCSPIKLFEYMSMQKPIIAAGVEQIAQSMVYNPTHQLEYSDSGIVVEAPYGADNFLCALKTMLSVSEDQRIQWGVNARKKAIDHFTWKIRMHNIIHFVQSKD